MWRRFIEALEKRTSQDVRAGGFFMFRTRRVYSNLSVNALAGWFFGTAFVCVVVFSAVSCRSPQSSSAARRGPSTTDPAPYGPNPQPPFQEVKLAALHVPLPEVTGAEYVNDDTFCMTCHEAYVKSFQHNVHRGQSCEKCHGPASRHLQTRGREPGTILSFRTLSAAARAELCLQCHEQDACSPGTKWRSSPHAAHGVSCTQCHTSHYNVPPGTPITTVAEAGQPDDNFRLALHQNGRADQLETPADMAMILKESNHMGAVTPHICLRCHSNMATQLNVAASHQICGANGFDCTTCHDPHGRLRPETRTDLCLKCHDNGSPTMAWHSSIHARNGVACADCHNPHPNQNVQQALNIQHTNIRRSPRSPMAVDEPYVCYKCHADVYAQTSMPSHHPIKEGKITCSDCHDSHGQTEDNLREPTINMVCYRCHAEKQGPFAYEHPPVTENCAICHNPHGAVANNLLRQPTTFLCLRCHTGHRKGPNFHDAQLLGDIGMNPGSQAAFYTDCTQCHNQIHGSDVPSPHLPNAKLR
jgi:DmsE family decaheme c-type cytochrome